MGGRGPGARTTAWGRVLSLCSRAGSVPNKEMPFCGALCPQSHQTLQGDAGPGWVPARPLAAPAPPAVFVRAPPQPPSPPPRPPEHIVFCADVVINRGVRSFCLFPPGLCAAFSVRTRWSGIDGGMPYSDLARAQLPAPGRLGSGHVRLNPHRLP